MKQHFIQQNIEVSKIIRNHLSNACKGLMAAMTSDLALIMIYGFILRAITGPDVSG